jgi:methionine aminotransferase
MEDFQGNIHSKLPRAGTTIFTVMSALSREHNAINLSQGFPDFDIDPLLADILHRKVAEGRNQYAPMQGLPELRQAIANKLNRSYGIEINPDSEVNVTAGATQAIYSAITSMVSEGDEVVLFAPAYDCYTPAIELNGGKAIQVELRYPDYSIPWAEVKKVVNHHTRMIIINTPHNPTGTVLMESDMKELERITKGSDIVVLSDEVYEHIIFDGLEHQSVMKYPELASRSMAVYSFGKTFHCTGWKMGYVVAPPRLMKEFRKVHQFEVFACNHPMQATLAEYLQNEEHYVQLPEFYQEKRDFFQVRMKDSRFDMVESKGTYFQLYRYTKISRRKDVDFAKWLTEECGVSAIPISVLYNNNVNDYVVRFCFAKELSTLERATDILCQI